MNSMLFFSLIIPIFAFILEAYPRFINRKFGVDIWTHLLYLREYHKQKGIPNKIEKNFLVPGSYDYPPAFIFILSKFPINLVEKYEFLFSPFFDAIHLILIFFISLFLINNLAIALVTQVLYMLTPIIILENSSATPRSLGYTLFTIVFMLMFLFSLTLNYNFLLFAVFFGALIFLSHRFTAQGFFFFSIFFSIIEKNFVYFGTFVFSMVLAIILSNGFYLRVLKGHIGNLIFWKNNIQYRFFHQINGSYKEHKTKDFIFKLYNQFLKFPPFVFTIANPWTLPVFYIIFFSFPSDPITQKLLWWVIFSYILAMATTLVPSFRFLGEAQRYLELSVFPSALLSAMFLFSMLNTNSSRIMLSLYIIVGFIAAFTIIFIQRKAIIKDTLRTVTPQMEEMFWYLKSLKVKPRLLCIPHQITTNTIYHSDCPVFVNADYADIGRISDVYPYLKKPINSIMKEYKLDAILLNEDYASLKDLKISKYKVLKKIENFLLISV